MVDAMSGDAALAATTRDWFERVSRHEYSYHFRWLGVPIIQFPQDIVAIQELIWSVRPELIVETGIAHGGSLLLSASILELIGGPGHVVGIDIDIREHARRGVGEHPVAHRIAMIEGSSVDPAVVARVHDLARGRRPVMVILDSNHTHDHVRQELDLYSALVTAGSFLVVLDTVIAGMSEEFSRDRPWGPSSNPSTALREFLATTNRFEDARIDRKLLITVAPGGYLRCTRD